MQCSVLIDRSLQNKKNMGRKHLDRCFSPRAINGNQAECAHLCRVPTLVPTAWRNHLCGNAKVDVMSIRVVATVSQMICTGVAPPSLHHPTNVWGISGALSLDTDGLIWPWCVCSNDNAAVTHKSHWPGVPPYTSLSASQCINANFFLCVWALGSLTAR